MKKLLAECLARGKFTAYMFKVLVITFKLQILTSEPNLPNPIAVDPDTRNRSKRSRLPEEGGAGAWEPCQICPLPAMVSIPHQGSVWPMRHPQPVPPEALHLEGTEMLPVIEIQSSQDSQNDDIQLGGFYRWGNLRSREERELAWVTRPLRDKFP